MVSVFRERNAFWEMPPTLFEEKTTLPTQGAFKEVTSINSSNYNAIIYKQQQ